MNNVYFVPVRDAATLIIAAGTDLILEGSFNMSAVTIQTPTMCDEDSPRGLFVTFEGTDGVGKTTQRRLVEAGLRLGGRRVRCLREPGATSIGEQIRRIVLGTDILGEGVSMDPVCEVMLYEAARAQLVHQVIRPALAAGEVVLCDRFLDSTVAYQGFARGLGHETVDYLNRLACKDVLPDRTFLLDMNPDEGLSRATAAQADRLELEGAAFQRLVREGFAHAAQADPSRIHVIDATGTPDQVYERIRTDLLDLCELPPYAQAALAAGDGDAHAR